MMIYTITPRRTSVTISRTILILVAVGLIVIAKIINILLIILLSIYLILMVLLLKVRSLEIHDDHFVINNRCWLKRFNTKTKYNYADIKKITFSPGYTNWMRAIFFAVMGMTWQGYGSGELSEASKWKIVKSDNSVEYVNSIGTDEEAEKATKYITSRLNTI